MSQASSRPSWQLNEFDRPLFNAAYFGFLPIESPRINDKDLETIGDYEIHPHFNAHDRAAFLRTYIEKDLSSLGSPLAVAYRKVRSSDYSLNMVGLDSGISEAILIRTALSILAEEGHKNTVVDINCIGDRDSISAYERELQQHARKIGPTLSPELKKQLKEDIFNLIRFDGPEAGVIRETLPSPIAFLSSASRAYFKEVLEHIEALGVEFRLAPTLVGNRHYCSHTIFAIKSTNEDLERTLAVGYRYTRLSKKVGFKKETPLAGVTIFSHADKEAPSKKVYKNLPKPKFYLVQLGRDAKMRALPLIELLRVHHIPVYHFLGKDKITVQLTNAESLRVPYLLILGQKEALDNTVTVRNVSTHAQETVRTDLLPMYLKSIRL